VAGFIGAAAAGVGIAGGAVCVADAIGAEPRGIGAGAGIGAARLTGAGAAAGAGSGLIAGSVLVIGEGAGALGIGEEGMLIGIPAAGVSLAPCDGCVSSGIDLF